MLAIFGPKAGKTETPNNRICITIASSGCVKVPSCSQLKLLIPIWTLKLYKEPERGRFISPRSTILAVCVGFVFQVPNSLRSTRSYFIARVKFQFQTAWREPYSEESLPCKTGTTGEVRAERRMRRSSDPVSWPSRPPTLWRAENFGCAPVETSAVEIRMAVEGYEELQHVRLLRSVLVLETLRQGSGCELVSYYWRPSHTTRNTIRVQTLP